MLYNKSHKGLYLYGTCGGDELSKELRAKADVFSQQWNTLNTFYEEYAKSVGFTYSSLSIFCVIFNNENCTQKIICEQTYLPKQTVNNVITNFYKKKYIYMVELAEDRRIKTIHLTPEGLQLAKKILPVVSDVEENAIGQFTEEEADTLLQLLKRYVAYCDKNMPR